MRLNENEYRKWMVVLAAITVVIAIIKLWSGLP